MHSDLMFLLVAASAVTWVLGTLADPIPSSILLAGSAR